MHPDDYKAHLAWITAKRFHELVLKETFPKNPYIAGLSVMGPRIL